MLSKGLHHTTEGLLEAQDFFALHPSPDNQHNKS